MFIAALLSSAGHAFAAHVIDVMVVYTPATASYHGGTSGVKALVNASVATMNTSLTNSGVDAKVRLVYAGQISYTESDSFNTDLTRLRGTNDSQMDEVHALRTTFGADHVVLIRRGAAGGVAGLAYVMTTVSTTFAPYAFSVVADTYAASHYAFAHELGHNLGCTHDHANASGSGAYSYSYGHNFNGANSVNYGTVMCYPGTRIAHFSNPAVNYQSRPTGVASGSGSANNALTIRNTAATAVQHRRTAGPNARSDFNGDGQADLIYFNATNGKRSIWLMNGTTFSGSVIMPGENTAWQPSGVGDFNGDGHPDIVFFNRTTGARSIWLMNGTTHTSSVIMPGNNLNWEPRACGDFNGDGNTDIVFFNATSGQRSIWLMSGTTHTSSVILPGANTAWVPAGCGDFNADGNTDIVFYNPSSGQRSIWLMAGTTHSGSVILPGANTSWIPGGCSDFDGDGNTDIIFFNPTSGQRSIWLMSGTTHSGSVILPGANQDWAPRTY